MDVSQMIYSKLLPIFMRSAILGQNWNQESDVLEFKNWMKQSTYFILKYEAFGDYFKIFPADSIHLPFVNISEIFKQISL
ncbi:hypothetical protein CEXT_217161 [Caerostris extrusa]|uniref:Uncharacterized protein n=1 Tax=Caerostris extrusa TaxID=172846 RepID=A0AAV4R0X8_CAEEX|nr:hypothetical protein CEXT_217161 [Caerostris extrusa]